MKIYAIRAVINIIVIAILVGCAIGVYRAQIFSDEKVRALGEIVLVIIDSTILCHILNTKANIVMCYRIVCS